MSLFSTIDADLKNAMKAHDELTLSVLRMLKSAIKNAEISNKKEATDEDIIKVIGKEIKTRKDSSTQYSQNARPELAEKEDKEIKILAKYMPAELSDDELKKIVAAKIAEFGKDKSNFGMIMGASMKEVAGRADGNRVSQMVNSELN